MFDPLVGRVLGDRYRILGRIAAGGMGQVYRAAHTRIACVFAVKVVWGDFAYDASMQSRFVREAEIASCLQSRHIVRVVDFSHDEGSLPYLVMELLDGPSLYDVIVREGALAPERAVRIAISIARGNNGVISASNACASPRWARSTKAASRAASGADDDASSSSRSGSITRGALLHHWLGPASVRTLGKGNAPSAIPPWPALCPTVQRSAGGHWADAQTGCTARLSRARRTIWTLMASTRAKRTSTRPRSIRVCPAIGHQSLHVATRDPMRSR